jgi:hypothetical protein
MIVKKMSLPRRTFLRGLGATVSLPLLEAMVPAFTAIAQTAAKPVQRVAFFYVPNGIQLINWHPSTEGPGFEVTPILSPLASVRDQMVVVSGLANSQADALDIGSGSHARAAGTWLNGVRPKRTEGADIQAGTTVDQYAARVLGKDTPLSSLQLALEPSFVVGNCEGGYSCTYVNTMSWQTPTLPLPMETNPHAVFERLFGDGSGGAARLAEMRANRSILDAMKEDMVRLQRALGSRDRSTVDEYLGAVRDVEQRLQKTASRTDPSSQPSIEAPLGIPDSFDEHAKLLLDLQLLAFQADITRVVTFQIARELSTRSYPEVGVPEAHHDISHYANNPEKMAKNTKINTYHVGLFAHLVEKMKATPDGDGSLLDHSMMLYGSGMGDGNLHRHHDLPLVVVGGGCGQLQGGRHLRFANDTPMMNLGLSLLDKIGVELESVGDSTGRLTGI